MKREKLVFRLERDDSGYPPVDFESLWIEILDSGAGKVDNIPFFTSDVALGDIVTFERAGGELRYLSTVKRSMNSLVRVVYYPPTDPADLRRTIEDLGCETELDAAHTLIAVSIPPNGQLGRLQKLLNSGEELGKLGYEEPILFDPESPGEGMP